MARIAPLLVLIVLAGCSAKKQLVVKHDFPSNSTHVEVRVELP